MSGDVWRAGLSRIERALAHPRAKLVGFVLVCVLGVALRAWHLDFKMPYLHHADEAHNVRHALRIVNERDLNPHFFRYPSLVFYTNALGDLIYFAGARLVGHLSQFSDIQNPIEPIWGVGFMPSTAPFLVGRLVSLLSSSLTLVLCFAMARRLAGYREALLVGALVALSPTNVVHSRFVSPDALTTLFVTLALYYAVRLFESGKLGDYVLAGLSIGLAAGAKYNGVFAAVAVVAAHFARPNALKNFWRLVVSGAVSAAAFAVTNPYILLDYQTFRRDLAIGEQRYSAHSMGSTGNPLEYYVDWLFTQEGLVSALALAFVVLAVARRSRAWLFMSAFPVVYLAFISRYATYNDRTLLPMVPAVCVMGGLAFFFLFDWLRAKASVPAARYAVSAGAVALGAVILIKPGYTSVVATQLEAQPDIVDEARDWINSHLPNGSRVAIEPFGPWVDTGRYLVKGYPTLSAKPPAYYAARYDYLVFAPMTYLRQNSRRARAGYAALINAFKPVPGFTDSTGGVRIFTTHP